MSAPIRTKVPRDASANGPSRTQGATRETPVRRLKPPPEIWEMVHPVRTAQFKPVQTFVVRVGSSWANLLLLAIVVALISGICATVWRLRGASGLPGPTTSQTRSTTEPSANRESRNSDTTKPLEESPTLSDTAIAVESTEANNEVPQTTSVSGKRSNKRPLRVESKASEPDSVAGTKTTEVSVSDKLQFVGGQPNDKLKHVGPLSPQLIAPLKPTSTRKAKVIQWP